MNRDELERLHHMVVNQKLDLDHPTQVRLLEHAMQHWPPRQHEQGCTWWTGSRCSCEPETPKGVPFDP